MNHPIIDRVTDWRYVLATAAMFTSLALVLFAFGQIHGERVQDRVIADKADQLATVRAQRDKANHRADVANERADSVTRIALAGIADLRCATYRQAQTGAVFARLVFASPNASDDQRKLVAPFVKPPAKPKGCAE